MNPNINSNISSNIITNNEATTVNTTSIPTHFQVYNKSIFAGVMIAIAGTANLSVDNKYIGAFLFSFGLITIIIQNWWLYTGKIGIVELPKGISRLAVTLLGNLIGVNFVIVGLILTNKIHTLQEKAYAIVESKLNASLVSIFILAVFCGIMMYLAVDGYQKNKNLLMIIFPIMIFILCGFEHSIANMYYFLISGAVTPRGLIEIVIMILGNTVGSLIMKVSRILK